MPYKNPATNPEEDGRFFSIVCRNRFQRIWQSRTVKPVDFRLGSMTCAISRSTFFQLIEMYPCECAIWATRKPPPMLKAANFPTWPTAYPEQNPRTPPNEISPKWPAMRSTNFDTISSTIRSERGSSSSEGFSFASFWDFCSHMAIGDTVWGYERQSRFFLPVVNEWRSPAQVHKSTGFFTKTESCQLNR